MSIAHVEALAIAGPASLRGPRVSGERAFRFALDAVRALAGWPGATLVMPVRVLDAVDSVASRGTESALNAAGRPDCRV